MFSMLWICVLLVSWLCSPCLMAMLSLVHFYPLMNFWSELCLKLFCHFLAYEGVWGVKIGVIERAESQNGVFNCFRPHLVAKNGKNCVFFAFCLIENHRDIWEMGRGNKKCLFMIYKHFLFSQLKIFSLKIFQNGHRTRKHGKLKSKKQIFTNFLFKNFSRRPSDPKTR